MAFPLIDFVDVFEELDVPLNHFGPRDIAPPPEFRRSGTSDARDSDGLDIVANRDPPPFEFRKRLGAGQAIPFSGQQRAGVSRAGLLDALNRRADAVGEFGNVGFAQSSNRYGLTGAIDGDGLQCRVLSQGVQHRTRQALAGVKFAHRFAL